ncbi:hypothetical protein AB0F81_37270 [Actinoplanes sp. NPDC024001]|uniref:hypothetical protein n=1 Tax=Actinoplanes sp. NPDC024001 TaxID=3154598 RepID=UPI0033C89EDA
MRTPRLAGLGLAAATAAALAVSGCAENGTAGPSASPSASGSASEPAAAAPSVSTSADPAAVKALADAAAALDSESFKLTVTAGSGFLLTALIDAPKGNGTADLKATGTNTELTVKSLLIGQDLYAQIPGITKGSTWTHLDMGRLPEGANTGLRPDRIDPVDTAQLIGSTTDVRATGPRNLAGTLDLTKAAGVAGLDRVTIEGYGPAAQRVPFTAELDDRGRLSVLTLQLPKSTTLEARYTDYGTTVTAERPPTAQIVEAPEDVYRALGG